MGKCDISVSRELEESKLPPPQALGFALKRVCRSKVLLANTKHCAGLIGQDNEQRFLGKQQQLFLLNRHTIRRHVLRRKGPPNSSLPGVSTQEQAPLRSTGLTPRELCLRVQPPFTEPPALAALGLPPPAKVRDGPFRKASAPVTLCSTPLSQQTEVCRSLTS